MSFSAHLGRTEDNPSSRSPRAHSTAWKLLRAMPLPDPSSQQTRSPPTSTSLPRVQLSWCFTENRQLLKHKRAKAAPPGREVDPSNHDGRNDKKANVYWAFYPGSWSVVRSPFNLLDHITGWPPYDDPHFINEREVRPLIGTAQVVGCRVSMWPGCQIPGYLLWTAVWGCLPNFNKALTFHVRSSLGQVLSGKMHFWLRSGLHAPSL